MVLYFANILIKPMQLPVFISVIAEINTVLLLFLSYNCVILVLNYERRMIQHD